MAAHGLTEKRNKDGYESLAEEIITLAIHDYRLVCLRMLKRRIDYKDIDCYERLCRFFYLNCNNLTSVGGQELIDAINNRYGIDAEPIQQRINRYIERHNIKKQRQIHVKREDMEQYDCEDIFK